MCSVNLPTTGLFFNSSTFFTILSTSGLRSPAIKAAAFYAWLFASIIRAWGWDVVYDLTYSSILSPLDKSTRLSYYRTSEVANTYSTAAVVEVSSEYTIDDWDMTTALTVTNNSKFPKNNKININIWQNY